MKVAVVGGGVTGLAAAHELARSGGARVTLYEKEDHLGGYARAVDVDDGRAPALSTSTSASWSSTRCEHTCVTYTSYKLVLKTTAKPARSVSLQDLFEINPTCLNKSDICLRFLEFSS